MARESWCAVAEDTVWKSPFNFPPKDGDYLGMGEDGYVIATFHRQDENTGHWFPSWGLKGWTTLPAFDAAKVVRHG